jgi:hypothetical protein
MTARHSHRLDVSPRGFYDTLMSFEMPEVWAVAYIIALAALCVFFLTA